MKIWRSVVVMVAIALSALSITAPQAATADEVCAVQTHMGPTTSSGKKAIEYYGRVACATGSSVQVRVCVQVLGLDYYGHVSKTSPTKCAGPGSTVKASATTSCTTLSGSYKIFARSNYTVSAGGTGGGTNDSDTKSYSAYCG